MGTSTSVGGVGDSGQPMEAGSRPESFDFGDFFFENEVGDTNNRIRSVQTMKTYKYAQDTEGLYTSELVNYRSDELRLPRNLSETELHRGTVRWWNTFERQHWPR